MKYDLNWLLQKHNAGEQLEYVYFWGHRLPSDNMAKQCFSQWFNSSFNDEEGVFFKTAEHYMMYHKAKTFKDDELIPEILKADHPQEAKVLGRKVKNFDSNGWDSVCFDIVVKGNYLKFSQNPELKEYILSTGNKILVEASLYDKIWGIGMFEDDKNIVDPKLWQGKNLLGFALMEARDQLI